MVFFMVFFMVGISGSEGQLPGGLCSQWLFVVAQVQFAYAGSDVV